MFPFFHFIKGFVKNIANPRVSSLAFISSSVIVDKSAMIYRGVKAKNAVIGAHSYVSASTDIENAEIGKYCSIADHCRIGMSGHSLNFISTSPIFTLCNNALQERWTGVDVTGFNESSERVYIGNDVWIGSHVLIKGGVHIGNGACVAAGAVVVKDIPPYAIVGGVPAKVIRYRFSDEVIDELQSIEWWNCSEADLLVKLAFFQKKINSIDDLLDFKSLNL